jgi:hypothetical protein
MTTTSSTRPRRFVHLLRALDAGFDVVYGPPHAAVALGVAQMSSHVGRGRWCGDGRAGGARPASVRAFRTRLRTPSRTPTAQPAADVLLAWGPTGSPPCACATSRARRRVGVTFRKLLNHLVYMPHGFSTAPLRVATWWALVHAIRLSVLVYVVTRYVSLVGACRGPVPRLVIAILAAHNFRAGHNRRVHRAIFSRSLERPPYVVAERTEAST